MVTPPLIRLITDDDVPSAAEALIEVYQTDGYPVEGVEFPEAWIRSPLVIQAWVAVANERVVGHVSLMRPQSEDAVSLWRERTGEKENQVSVLGRLFVVRKARKQAVGESLMRAAMDYAKEHSLRLVLDVMEKDASAIRLYERLGWMNIGQATHHYGEGQAIRAICYAWPSE